MKLYNSLTRQKEELKYKPGERVNLFVCGPTTYDLSHLGHAKTYLAYDGMVKFLRRHLGWDIFYLQNITDSDERIITRAKETNKDPLELAHEFEDLYYKDMKALSVDSIDKYSRATAHIPEIISQVERLIKNGSAYKIEGEGYYFDVKKFKDYGKLSGRTVEQAEDAVSRIDESISKRNKADFVLWRLTKEGEFGWDSSLGFGQPGWHIEDTAITEKNFGPTYDIHGGGLDLKFPHHEAEITQMESLSGKSPVVKIWMHTGLLRVNNERMGKSLGNAVTIIDFLKKESPHTLRMLVFSSLYRSPVNYTNEVVEGARAKVSKLSGFFRKLKTTKGEGEFSHQEYIDNFWAALEDDFNTPKALATLFDLVSAANKQMDIHKLSSVDAQKMLGFMNEINAIFSIIPEEEDTPQEVKDLLKERKEARKNKDFEASDKLRKEIESKGYRVSDSDGGSRVYRI